MAYRAGLHEVYNYPWTENKIVSNLGIDKNEMVELAYPPSEQQQFLQTSLVLNLISTVETNVKYNDNFGFFEIARVFQKNKLSSFSTDGESLPNQPKRLSGAVVGTSDDEVYAKTKGICEALFARFYIPVVSSSDKLPQTWLDTGRAQSFLHENKSYGFVGFLKKSIAKSFAFDSKSVCFFEIDLTEIQELISIRENKYKPLPQFPGVTRDIAIEVPEAVKWDEIKKMVEGSSDILSSIELFDVYKGRHISENRKSVAFRLLFISENKTLESEEVDKIVKNIIKKLETNLGAILRT